MAAPDVAIPTGPLHRLARRPDPWAWPDWAFLRDALPDLIVRHGLDDLDGAAVRSSAPRAFTQAVSRHVYEQASTVGIRYLSRLGDDGVNWAIQEPVTLPATRAADVTADDPDLHRAIELFGLALV